VLATANHAIFYDAHQPYRRCVRDPRGDHCLYLAVSRPLLAEALSSATPRFPFVQGPSRPDDYLVQHVVWRALRRGDADALVVDETLLRLLGRVVAQALHRGAIDLAIGLYTSSAGAFHAGQVRLYSGRTGALLRTITSVRPREQLGFDAVGLGDVNADGVPDLLLTAAHRDRVYVVAGRRP
jgi:hypothetical protein